MWFSVKLLRVPPIQSLTGWDVFELMVNARHVGGDFWIFEGDVESLGVAGVEMVAEGEAQAYGDMSDEDLVSYCEGVFDITLSSIAPSWKMLSQASR